MAWYYWILIIVSGLVIILFTFSYIIFNLIFKRKEGEPLLTNRDLSTTYYKNHKDKIDSSFSFLYSLNRVEHTLISRDNLKLKGYYYNNNSDTTIIFTHGYHSNPFNNFSYVASTLYKEGYNIFFIHQRSHNNSEGKYVTFGIKERYDLLDWMNEINKEYKPKNIILYGLSMGCATTSMALGLNIPTNVKAAILDCGFDNIHDLMCYQLRKRLKINPYIIVKVMNVYAKALAKFSFYETSSSESLKKTKIPCFFIHGTEDKTVPFNHGQTNYNSCLAYKENVFLEGKEHAVCYYEGLPDLEQKILKFINKALNNN